MKIILLCAYYLLLSWKWSTELFQELDTFYKLGSNQGVVTDYCEVAGFKKTDKKFRKDNF